MPRAQGVEDRCLQRTYGVSRAAVQDNARHRRGEGVDEVVGTLGESGVGLGLRHHLGSDSELVVLG